MREICRTSRRLAFWDYSVSHKELLVRSAASASDPMNLDLVFIAVDHIQGATRFPPGETTLAELTDDEASLRGWLGTEWRSESTSVFAFLHAEKVVCFVTAARVFKKENSLGPKESSLSFPMIPPRD